MSPKISVIVPVYNAGEYLSGTVNSLLAQTHKNIEIILVDDGSTDSSPAIIDRFAAENANVIAVHTENRGVSCARNEGLRRASGDYIGFCDSDDIADADMYEFMLSEMQAHNADLYIGELRFVLPNGTVKEIATNQRKVWDKTEDFLIDFFSNKVRMSVDTKLFSRRVCENTFFPENYRINEDKYFCFLTALNANRIISVNVAKYSYVRHVGSSSFTEFNDKYFDAVRLADKICETTCERFPELSEAAQCNKLATVIRFYKLMNVRGGLGKYPEEERKMVGFIKGFDKAAAKRYLTKKDRLRFSVIRFSPKAFRVMTLWDKN